MCSDFGGSCLAPGYRSLRETVRFTKMNSRSARWHLYVVAIQVSRSGECCYQLESVRPGEDPNSELSPVLFNFGGDGSGSSESYHRPLTSSDVEGHKMNINNMRRSTR